jgi:DNA-binding transcriptional ArsR family regulator
MSLEVAAGDPGRQEQLRALSHPVRLRILSLLTARAMSSAELARELGMNHAAVSYHVRQLARAGYLEVAETRSVRGGQERRYRAVFGGRGQWEQEDPQLVVRAVTEELSRRLAEGPSTWRVFADAELWVDPGMWADVRARVASAMADLHNAAAPPHSEGSVRVSATAMLFQVGTANGHQDTAGQAAEAAGQAGAEPGQPATAPGRSGRPQ